MVAVGNTDRLKFRVSLWGVLCSPSALGKEDCTHPCSRGRTRVKHRVFLHQPVAEERKVTGAWYQVHSCRSVCVPALLTRAGTSQPCSCFPDSWVLPPASALLARTATLPCQSSTQHPRDQPSAPCPTTKTISSPQVLTNKKSLIHS